MSEVQGTARKPSAARIGRPTILVPLFWGRASVPFALLRNRLELRDAHFAVRKS
jgi:hypothetical protein